MKKIVIVGAGRVGLAMATLLQRSGEHEVLIIDSNESALNTARDAEGTYGWSDLVRFELCLNMELLEACLRRETPYAVACCTPFSMNVPIAAVCAKLKCNYVDFTEDVGVTKAVTEMNPAHSTFVLQTGLAPGLVTCVGLSLIEKLKDRGLTPTGLHLRVGALPLVAELPAAYALTWSTNGLINEYLQPVERIVDGKIVIDEALDDHEELIIDGEHMEAFNTSGGVGSASMYDGLHTVDYKTMRYPGHLDFLQKRIMSPLAALPEEERLAHGVKLAEEMFHRTRDDVVYMVVRARGVDATGAAHEAVFQHKFYGDGVLTALEFTTAGTGAAVIEAMEHLPRGIVFGGAVPLYTLRSTPTGARLMGKL